ncbi:ARM repeat-containing protein [Aaosphaeria arxii CBS 175.79]|uniref:ARM repeat-containing protein n=1 Tax=Aaosphaeria arxii CBS 175.79 TaxID=1450172 RepID=A0A6A5Y750_9PLEO|nr:ARM repeat-containing protein [Aaosphaeria arxii CBS 175.79]KAF2021119.1 ARM repeat-containing protein [Aaosphaeria arxii CBS 175.79]
MPGRPASRSARSSGAGATRKSSSTTAKSRSSVPAVEVPDEGEVTSLRTQICQIFGDAQKTTATQRKLVVSLRKIQEACCYEAQDTKKKRVEEEFDEADFNEEVARCVTRIMAVKKSEPVGDRIIRFLGIFLKHATEKDNAILQPDDEQEMLIPETPSSRLTSHILSTILTFIEVKDKTVRFRATQTVAHIVNSLDQIDDELFDLIRLKLAKRLRDKEPSVRVQAVLGLGRLADNDDEEEDEEDSDDDTTGRILIKLLDIMQNDPSAEVRRAVLMNLPFRPNTLKWLLERARDSDPGTRRALYGKLLPALGDFRHMSMVEREKLIRWGLRDRDEMVRKATARLFRERWIDHCAQTHNPTPEEERKPGEVFPPNMDALLELLERISITHSGTEEGMAHEAMREFWDGRPDYRDFVTFDDDFWNGLTPESAFVARSLNDYCVSLADDSLQDEKMPAVMAFAFFVQTHLNRLMEVGHRIAELDEDHEDYQEMAEEASEQEFVVEQLLHIALTLDYSDEVGRRQMFSIMRDALARVEFPEECTKLGVEVLRTVCGGRDTGEKEFCSVILEAIAEVRDTLMPDEATEVPEDAEDSFHSAQSDATVSASNPSKKAKEEEDPEAEEQRQIREALVFLKCLHIAQCMLQNVYVGLEDNNALVTILNTLIVPAVRSHDENIRERGVVCLGLAGLLSKDLASSNVELFLHCYSIGPDSLKVIVIQVLTDIIITHPTLIAPLPPDPEDEDEEQEGEPEPTPNPWLKHIMKMFLKAFNSDKRYLALEACVAGSKLLFLNVLPPASVAILLKAFTLAYFDPDTASNTAVSQALSYFLPVFCHSRAKNALLMSQLAVPVIQKLLVMREDIDEEADEMVGWPIVAGHLSEWTDGRRVVGATEQGVDGKINNLEGAEEPHIQLAIDILERALRDTCTRDEKKPLLSLLTKLYISSTPSKHEAAYIDALRDLHQLVSEAVEAKLGLDATSRNYLAKLETSLTKRLGEVEAATQAQGEEVDETEVPPTSSSPPRAGTASQRQSGTPEAQSEVPDDDNEDEDTMLAGMQAEGTRMPLEEGDDDEDNDEDMHEGTILPVRGGRRHTAFTEDDIMESLLNSEM